MPSDGDFGVGLACCAVAALGFGSNYLPVKRVDCGDGFFFALCMAVGIGIVGLVLNYSEMTTGTYFEGPQFQPRAMLGGTCWMLGNLLTPTVIRLIGLGVGLSVWDLSNMVMGWATGYFGLFGIWREPAATPWLNFLGIGLAGVSLLVIAQAIEDQAPIEKRVTEGGKCCGAAAPDSDDEDSQPDVEMAAAQGRGSGGDEGRPEESGRAASSPRSPSSIRPSAASPQPSAATEGARAIEGRSPCDEPTRSGSSTTLPPSGETPANGVSVACSARETPHNNGEAEKPPRGRRYWVVGLSLALLAGVLFGWTFNASTLLMQKAILGDPRFSTNHLDYVLSNYVGIVVTGVICFLMYLCVMRRSAFVRTEVILPGIASGAMWAVAQAAWFKANEELSMALSFPLISSLPGMVALFWGVCFFGELRSRRARQFAAVAVALRIPSVAFIAMSGVE